MKKIILVLLLILLASFMAAAEENASESNAVAIDMVWMLIAAFLVFFMQAGFAMVEFGFTRAKNAGNIIMKNLMDFSVSSLVFWAIGFGIMFGISKLGIFGTSGFFLSDGDPATAEGQWTFGFWMFQCVFAATAATIVSGAMAERTKFFSYLIYSVFISALIYPIVGKWAWGSLLHGDSAAGWLEGLGFLDFAGSTVVHSVGGWTALAGAVVLGPRLGKYLEINGKRIVKAIPGHNIPLATLGVFILWFGWFGFNAGSTTAGTDPSIAFIAINTSIAAAASAISAMIFAWIRFGKPDTSMSLNGALAGLVAITAGCAFVSPGSSIIIGLVSGVLVVAAVEFIDKVLHVDDPVGAISVHGVCGAFGTLSVGLFAEEAFGGVKGLFFGGGASLLGVQFIGTFAVFIFVFISAMILFLLIKITVGLRVNQEEELKGLDISEHGVESYSGFQIFTTK